MHHEQLLASLLFFASFLVVTSILREVTKRLKFPYTVGLLIVGFSTQFFIHLLGISTHIYLSPDIIFFVLLPVLLFEASLHINFHQFGIQFRTITFLATFGLLLSISIVGVLGALLLGLPFGAALLFGSLISATDPIAVLALFKSIGAPKRLALIADGESMFNDAVAVLLFRLISGFVVADLLFEPVHLVGGLGRFIYVFVGSILFGSIAGYLTSKVLHYIRKDPLVETTITVALAFGSFVLSDHYLGLSGVISIVMAGIVLANIGKTKISEGVMPFIEEIWEYFSFIALSIVFFFAAFNMDWSIFRGNFLELFTMVIIVIFARAVSVYTTFGITNKLSFFSKEPNVPTKWQHVINWGGLRGVIPLVLVFSLPETYEFYDEILAFTFSILLFSLFVNGLTIERLLKKLGIHIPKKEEVIIKEESTIFDLEEALELLDKLKDREEFHDDLIDSYSDELKKEEEVHKQKMLELAGEDGFERSLKLEALRIERNVLKELFRTGHIPESVFFEFEAQLDLQQDALEYPEVYSGRGFTDGGLVKDRISYRLQMHRIKRIISKYPFLSKLLRIDTDQLVINRHSMLRARITTSQEVFSFLDKVESLIDNKDLIKSIHEVRRLYKKLQEDNEEEIREITEKHPSLVREYQERVIDSLIERKLSGSNIFL